MVLGMELIPIAPIILMPFILIFFVIVFPIWGVALGVLGLVLLIIRGLDLLAKKAGVHALGGMRTGMEKTFRWVLTFGGLVRQLKREETSSPS